MTDIGLADDDHWITIRAERVLYVDYGRDTILCDRFPGGLTLVLKLSSTELQKLAAYDQGKVTI